MTHIVNTSVKYQGGHQDCTTVTMANINLLPFSVCLSLSFSLHQSNHALLSMLRLFYKHQCFNYFPYPVSDLSFPSAIFSSGTSLTTSTSKTDSGDLLKPNLLCCCRLDADSCPSYICITNNSGQRRLKGGGWGTQWKWGELDTCISMSNKKETKTNVHNCCSERNNHWEQEGWDLTKD